MCEARRERARSAIPGTEAIAVGGRTFLADSTGALYWAEESTLVVADLHLEKASANAEHGELLPPYDTRETLARLGEAIGRHAPRRVLALGDSLHDCSAPARIPPADAARLRSLQRGREWIWVTGNHDPEIAPGFGGTTAPEVLMAGLELRHVPTPSPTGPELAGHLHPVARLAGRGATLRRPCFVGNGERLVLPAFGALTGGLNVLDEAFAPLFAGGPMHVWMLGQEGVYAVPPGQLRGD